MPTTIKSNKISNPQELWTFSVTFGSTTVLSVKQQIQTLEGAGVYPDISKVRLFNNAGELSNNTIIDTNIIAANGTLSVAYAQDITLCGMTDFFGSDPNGFYRVKGIDSNKKVYWSKDVTNDFQFVWFDDGSYPPLAQWVISHNNIIDANNPTVATTTPIMPPTGTNVDITVNTFYSYYGSPNIVNGNVPNCISVNNSSSDSRYDIFAKPNESGIVRAKRLWALGYI
jgi:hypothetical protein